MRRACFGKVSKAFALFGSSWALVMGATLPSPAEIFVDRNSDGFPESIKDIRFTCELTQRGWTMFGRLDHDADGIGDGASEFSPMITFSAMGGASAEERCQAVTSKFNDVNALGSRYYLKTDTVFSVLPTGDEVLVSEEAVICAVLNYGNSCMGDGSIILFTMSPHMVSNVTAQERMLGRLLDHIAYLTNRAAFITPFERPAIVTN